MNQAVLDALVLDPAFSMRTTHSLRYSFFGPGKGLEHRRRFVQGDECAECESFEIDLANLPSLLGCFCVGVERGKSFNLKAVMESRLATIRGNLTIGVHLSEEDWDNLGMDADGADEDEPWETAEQAVERRAEEVWGSVSVEGEDLGGQEEGQGSIEKQGVVRE